MERELLRRFEELVKEKEREERDKFKYKDIIDNLIYILNESKDNKIDKKILDEIEQMYLDI